LTGDVSVAHLGHGAGRAGVRFWNQAELQSGSLRRRGFLGLDPQGLLGIDDQRLHWTEAASLPRFAILPKPMSSSDASEIPVPQVRQFASTRWSLVVAAARFTIGRPQFTFFNDPLAVHAARSNPPFPEAVVDNCPDLSSEPAAATPRPFLEGVWAERNLFKAGRNDDA